MSKALRKYYAAHVAYPSSLAPVLNAKLPPPAKDRFGDAWVYRLETFSRIQGLESQKFALFSSTIGKESMPLKPTLRKGYAPGYAATLISVKALNNTQMAEFEATSPGNAAQKGLTNEGGRAVNGWEYPVSVEESLEAAAQREAPICGGGGGSRGHR